MSSITSEEVNYLIYRYLQEAGFLHSAYCFGQESFIAKATINNEDGVPPGALIGLLQKGLHYTSIEIHLNEDGTEKQCSRPFSLLENHVCEQEGISTAVNIINSKQRHNMLPSARGSYDREPPIPVALAPASLSSASIVDHSHHHHNQHHQDIDVDVRKSSKSGNGTVKAKKKKSRPPDAMDIDSSGNVDGEKNVTDKDVYFLREGLRSDITLAICAPCDNVLLTSGTANGWLQLWTRDASKTSTFVMSNEFDFTSSKDITAISWKPDCHSVAVASVDGSVRVVDCIADKKKITTLSHHQGPVFATKWSPSGSHLVSAGVDQSVAVWEIDPSIVDEDTVQSKRTYHHHKGPVMDVDWRTDDSFATCSVDRTILVYNNWIEQSEPVQVFTGHDDDVNSIAWDPSRTILASCSDDCTARLWKSSQAAALHVLSDHKKELYSIRWSPVESRSGSHWLATASLDTTVKLWDAETGKCVRTLAKHKDAAYAVAFSPDGDYLATGARDSTVHIWSLREGIVVRSFSAGTGGVLDLSWTRDGHSLCASSSNDICVFEMPSTFTFNNNNKSNKSNNNTTTATAL